MARTNTKITGFIFTIIGALIVSTPGTMQGTPLTFQFAGLVAILIGLGLMFYEQ